MLTLPDDKDGTLTVGGDEDSEDEVEGATCVVENDGDDKANSDVLFDVVNDDGKAVEMAVDSERRSSAASGIVPSSTSCAAGDDTDR